MTKGDDQVWNAQRTTGLSVEQDERGAAYLPCPICNGVEGCDHAVPERARAAALKGNVREIMSLWNQSGRSVVDFYRATLARAASTSANVAQGAEAIYEAMATDDDATHANLWMEVDLRAFEVMKKRPDMRTRIVYAAPPAQTARPAVAWMDPSDPDDATAFTRDADEAHCNPDTFSVALVESGGAK